MAKPPFTQATAFERVKRAQDLWNTMDPEKVTKAYTEDCIWRNRTSFFSGSAPILEFLIEKWKKEKNYKLRKELFSFNENKIAVQFWYEYQDAYDDMKWKRCYGLEDWTFSTDGRNCKRQMSANDIEISDEERWFKDGVDINEVDIAEEHW